MSMLGIEEWKRQVSLLKQNIYALWLASKDPRTSFLAKLVIVVTLAYALSPIDLIPDFIPILGLLDDLILVPFGFWLAVQLISDEVWQDCREKAEKSPLVLPKNNRAAIVIVSIWLVIIAWLVLWWLKASRS